MKLGTLERMFAVAVLEEVRCLYQNLLLVIEICGEQALVV